MGLGAAGAILLVLFVFLPLLVTVYAVVVHHRRRPKVGRRWSFTSGGLARGTFPARVQHPDPIINAVALLRKSDNNDVEQGRGSAKAGPAPSSSCPTNQEVADHVIRPLLEYERLAMVPDTDYTDGVRPSDDGLIQPDQLVRRIVVDGDDDQSTFDAIVEHLQDPLSHSRPHGFDLPWWEILVVENTGRGRSALVLRVHHCLADGISLVHAFSKAGILTDATTGDKVPASLLLKHRFTNTDSMNHKKGYAWTDVAKEVLHVLGLGLTKYDSDTVFSKHFHGKMVHSQQLVATLFPAVPLALIKDIKEVANVTVNDVLLAAMSQAIYDYCVEQEDSLLVTPKSENKKKPVQCRALFPVALPRRPKDLRDPAAALSNQFVMLSGDIALSETNLKKRLRKVHANLMDIKESPRAGVQLWIQNKLMPLAPVPVARQTVLDVFSRHSMVFANVPGPTVSCRIAGGCIVDQVQTLFGNLIHQVSLVSYADQIYGNIVADPQHLPRPRRLAYFYGRAIVQLAQLYKVTTHLPEDLLAAAENDQDDGGDEPTAISTPPSQTAPTTTAAETSPAGSEELETSPTDAEEKDDKEEETSPADAEEKDENEQETSPADAEDQDDNEQETSPTEAEDQDDNEQGTSSTDKEDKEKK